MSLSPSKVRALKDATRVYTTKGLKAHLIRNAGSRVAVCGAFQPSWLGTGSQDEHDRASVMQTCKLCLERV